MSPPGSESASTRWTGYKASALIRRPGTSLKLEACSHAVKTNVRRLVNGHGPCSESYYIDLDARLRGYSRTPLKFSITRFVQTRTPPLRGGLLVVGKEIQTFAIFFLVFDHFCQWRGKGHPSRVSKRGVASYTKKQTMFSRSTRDWYVCSAFIILVSGGGLWEQGDKTPLDGWGSKRPFSPPAFHEQVVS